MISMNKEELKELLPHREPMLLLDEAELVGDEAHGKITITGDEYFLQGHFPGNPVMPGVLIMEALAQTGAVAILSLPEHRGKTAYFAGIDKAKFKQMVRPGDTLELETTIIRSKGPVGVGEAIATVNGKLAAKAELTFALK